MIGLYCFVAGVALGMFATFLNVLFNYDGEDATSMIIWSVIILVMLTITFLFFSIVTFGGMII